MNQPNSIFAAGGSGTVENDSEKKFPLSHNQRSIFFMERLISGSPVYHLSFAFRFGEETDPDILSESLIDLVRCNDSLRTIFVTEQTSVSQIIKEEMPFDIPIFHIEGESEAETVRIMDELKDKPFDLAKGPLFRVALFKGAKELIFLVVLHHIICDFWSLSILLKELSLIYTQKLQGLDDYQARISNKLSYEHFVRRQKEILDHKPEMEDYWKNVLSGELPALNIHTDKPRPPIQSWNGGSAVLNLDRDDSERVVRFCKQRGIAKHVFFLSLFQILLQKYTGQNDILVGALTSGRPSLKFSETIGYFVNPVVIRGDLSGDPGFSAFLERSKEATLGAFAHKDYPFDLVVEQLNLPRDLSRSPVFQAMFTYQKLPRSSGSDLKAMNATALNRSTTLEFGGMSVRNIPLIRRTVEYELTLIAAELDEGVGLSLEYNSDLFHPETARRMLLHYETLLRSALDEPEQKLSDLNMLNTEERELLLGTYNNTKMPYEPVCLHRPIEKQAELTPRSVALVFGNQSLSYQDLSERSGRLANYLRRQGLQENQPVVLCMERSVEMVVGLLAILKAGAYYLPLDPSYPRERLAMITEDAAKGGRPPLLLTQDKLLDLFPEYQGTVVRVDQESALIDQESEDGPETTIDNTSLAYTIYTSGSTGRPKGVKISHRSLVNFLESMRREPGMTPRDALLAVTTISFDIAGLELWLPLMTGAKIVMADENEARDGRILARLLDDHSISVMQATPSTWKILLESGWKGRAGMKVLCGGEALSPALAERLLDKGVEVWNLYGPTETTIWSSLCKVPKNANPISIGHPIGNTSLYVLDAHQKPVPMGVSGELYIGGDGVAEGYTRDDATTSGKFLPDPFASEPDARMYRTGDLVRRLPDGDLEFLNRLDHQVKIRGHRIETGEIETVLRLHPHVKEAVVVVKQTKTDLKQLVAYYVSDGTAEPRSGELRGFLKDKLPDYMIPSYFVLLEGFPLTPNGKIDRKKLPDPEIDRADLGNQYVAPQSQIEKQIAGIYKEILGAQEIGVNDRFFDLGGNSILVTLLQSRLMEEFPNRDISIVDLFQYTSVAELSGFLRGETADTAEKFDTKIREKVPMNDDIAIVGMACRFPGSENLEAFWENLAEGRECITFYSEDELRDAGVSPQIYNDPRYVKASGSIDGIENFDANFFHYSPREASLIDPQQRIFLQEAWRAMEDAGYVSENFPGNIGVYASTGMNTYLYNNLQSHKSLFSEDGSYQAMISNDKDFIATRTSYELNLTGPSVTVQTACSSSLVAVHMACQAIRNGECDMALAGGVSLRVPQKAGYMYNEGMILSPDGHCRAFDEKARGTVIGNGAGAVLLKPLTAAVRDGDTIYAVIKGSALNNDGSRKAHFTAPGPERQTAVIRSALKTAGVKPGEISYVETHGTGTVIGDPIEITALTRAFSPEESRRNVCAIGSVKTNIGHLDAAAGVAGLIKTALALYHGKLPASLNYENPNPKIDFEKSPFYVNTELKDWDFGGPTRYAGVSSFGIGGTNAHMIMGEAPKPAEALPSDRRYHIMALSAQSPGSLSARAGDLKNYLHNHTDISSDNMAYTLATGRVPMRYRAAFAFGDIEEASRLLTEPDSAHVFSGVADKNGMKVAFLFPGQGSQYINMGKALYETEALFRGTMDECFALVKKFSGADLKSIIYPDADCESEAAALLEQTAYTQPAIFVLEYSLAKLLISWGIGPAAMCGHSIGEYAAACIAGVFSLEDAVRLVTLRAGLISSLPEGKMLSVSLREDALLPMLDDTLSVAAVNGIESCVVSGPSEKIEELSQRFSSMGIQAKELSVSHAFHSSMLDPILPDFKSALGSIKLNAPSMRYISSCTGTWIDDSEAASPDYWVRHLRHTVRFADAANVILGLPDTVVLELGPGKALGSLLRKHPLKENRVLILNSLPHPLEDIPADQSLYKVVARLWVAGAFDEWAGFYENESVSRQKIHLPGYSFEKRRCWIEPGKSAVHSSAEDEIDLGGNVTEEGSEQFSFGARPLLSNEYVPAQSEDEKALAAIWENILGVDSVGVMDNFFELGGTSLILTQLLTQMRQRFGDLPFTIKGLYENPTIREAAKYAEALRLLRESVSSGGDYEEGEL